MAEQEPADGVVFHLDDGDPGVAEAVVRNIGHTLDELGEGTPIELVAHGPGLDHLLDGSAVAEGLARVRRRGVLLSACRNTMERKGVSPEQLLPGVGTVQAGVAQLVRRQRQGWAYVRP